LISVDSYGWIERFTEGPKSSGFNRIIDGTPQEEIITSVVTLYEVYRKVKKARDEETALEAVASPSSVEPTTRPTVLNSLLTLGEVRQEDERQIHFHDRHDRARDQWELLPNLYVRGTITESEADRDGQ
jgi:hypothetical protein